MADRPKQSCGGETGWRWKLAERMSVDIDPPLPEIVADAAFYMDSVRLSYVQCHGTSLAVLTTWYVQCMQLWDKQELHVDLGSFEGSKSRDTSADWLRGQGLKIRSEAHHWHVSAE